MSRSYASHEEEFDALDRACHFHIQDRLQPWDSSGPDSWGPWRHYDAPLYAAFGIVAMADEPPVLGGLATQDIAMTIVKMLASCRGCGQRPRIPAAVFAEVDRWFDVSFDLCHVCLSRSAVRLHQYRARGNAGDDDYDDDVAANEAGNFSQTGADAWVIDTVQDGPGMNAEEAETRLCRLVRQGVLRPLEIVVWQQAARIMHTIEATDIAYSPDGRMIARGSHDKTVKLLVGSKFVRELVGHTRQVTSVNFSPDGAKMATGSFDETARLWDVVSGDCLHVLHGHTSWVTAVAFSPNGATIATSSTDRTTRLWDTLSGKCECVLQGHTDGVRSVAYTPNGRTIATGSNDQTVRLWDIPSGSCRRVLRGHTRTVRAVAFSPDGATMATGSFDMTVRVWNVASGQCQRVLEGHAYGVTCVAYSPDGRTIASSGSGIRVNSRTVRMWDAVTGDCWRVYMGDAQGVSAVAFSPDGQQIVTNSEEWHATRSRVRTPAALHSSGMDAVVPETAVDDTDVSHVVKYHRYEEE